MKKYFCDECNKEVETEIREHKNKKFMVEGKIIIVDIIERDCLLCSNAIYDEAVDNETLKRISNNTSI